MLIVADKPPRGIGRECGLAGAGEPEEQGHIAILPRPLIGGAVHRQDISSRQQPMHQREDTLLHLAGIFAPQDHLLAALQAQIDAGAAGHLGRERVGGKLASVVDHIVWRAKSLQLLERRPDEHGVHEQRVVGTRTDHPDLHAQAGIPAGKSVAHIDLITRVEIIDGPLPIEEECVVLDGPIDSAPPHILFRGGVPHHVLVQRAPAGLGARSDGDGSTGHDRCMLAGHGIFVELGRRGVPHHHRHVDFMGRKVDRQGHRTHSQ